MNNYTLTCKNIRLHETIGAYISKYALTCTNTRLHERKLCLHGKIHARMNKYTPTLKNTRLHVRNTCVYKKYTLTRKIARFGREIHAYMKNTRLHEKKIAY